MTAPELEALYAKRPQVIKPGLERLQAALACLPDIQSYIASTPTLLIGGTNGKGTTSGYAFQLLAALRLPVGLFTSPHLREFRERIRCSHHDVDDTLLKAALQELQRCLPAAVYEPMSFFEINTLLALAVFRQLKVEVMVLEVGLGGRWDSTNIAAPSVSIITSIGLDHQEFLGHNSAAIAREKAGIMRPGCPVLWGGRDAGEPEADLAIRDEAKARGAVLLSLGEEISGEDFSLPERWKRLPYYLQRNAALAFAGVERLLLDQRLMGRFPRGISRWERVGERIDLGEIMIPPSLIARFQELELLTPSGHERLLLDVCHNPDGARAFARAVREAGWAPCPALVSVLGDKDVNRVLDELSGALGPLILFRSSSERSWQHEQLAERHRQWPWVSSLAAAWEQRLTIAPAFSGVSDKSARPLVICGSVAVVGEVLDFLNLPVLS